MEKSLVKRSEDFNKVIEDYLFSNDLKLSKQQKILFLNIAKEFNLNPFKREIYAVSFNGKLSIITGYQTYIERANKTGLLAGWKVDIIKKGDKIEGAKITIYRKDWNYPFEWVVSFNEFYKNTHIWKTMPEFMIKKVAIAQGFRLAFPDYLGGMPYIKEELGIEEEPVIQEVKTETKPFDKQAFFKAIEELLPSEKAINEVLSKYNLKEFEEVDDRNLARAIYNDLLQYKEQEQEFNLSDYIKSLDEKTRKKFFAILKKNNIQYEAMKQFSDVIDKKFIDDIIAEDKETIDLLAEHINKYLTKEV